MRPCAHHTQALHLWGASVPIRPPVSLPGPRRAASDRGDRAALPARTSVLGLQLLGGLLVPSIGRRTGVHARGQPPFACLRIADIPLTPYPLPSFCPPLLTIEPAIRCTNLPTDRQPHLPRLIWPHHPSRHHLTRIPSRPHRPCLRSRRAMSTSSPSEWARSASSARQRTS